jgi:hypothetical protein
MYCSIDVMSCTMSPITNHAAVSNQLEYIDVISTVYQAGLATSFTCPPELFRSIIYINYLRCIRDNTENHDAWIESVNNVLNEIQRFSPSEWVKSTIPNLYARTPTGEIRQASQKTGSEQLTSAWVSVVRAYHASAALYCIDCMAGKPDTLCCPAQSQVVPEISKLRTTFYDTLMDSLNTICSASDRFVRLRRTLFWPVVVAGVETAPDQAANKQFITTQLEWLSSAIGSHAPLEAKHLFDRAHIPSNAKSADSRTPWEAVFTQPFAIVL